MPIIPEEDIINFSVRYFDKSIWPVASGLDEDVIQVSYDNYKYALQGKPADFEAILQKLLKQIKSDEEAA
jgi:hypothetical protein